MVRARVVTLVLVGVLAAFAGCLSDAERTPQEAEWAADVTVHEAPAGLVHERPVQVHAAGSITLDPGSAFELTGVEGSIEVPNGTVELQPARVQLPEHMLEGDEVPEEQPEVVDGARLSVSMVPVDPDEARLPESPVNVTVELLYRYEQGDAFDAGRIPVTANATRALEATAGVARVNDTGVHRLVLPDLDRRFEGSITVSAYHVGENTVEYSGHLDAELSRGEGVSTVSLAQAEPVPEGEGYLLFRVEAGEAVAAVVHRDRAAEDPLPAPGLPVAVAAGLAAALLARTRNGRSDGSV